jgi:hypothetical protein
MHIKKETNYISQIWWVDSLLGEIKSSLLVNAHRFNTVPPEQVGSKIDQVIENLKLVKELYSEQYKETTFNIER